MRSDSENESLANANHGKQLKIVLSVHQQHYQFTTSLMDSLVRIKVEIDNCLQSYQNELQQIHEAVKFRTAVPTEKIFVIIYRIVFFFFRYSIKNV